LRFEDEKEPKQSRRMKKDGDIMEKTEAETTWKIGADDIKTDRPVRKPAVRKKWPSSF